MNESYVQWPPCSFWDLVLYAYIFNSAIIL